MNDENENLKVIETRLEKLKNAVISRFDKKTSVMDDDLKGYLERQRGEITNTKNELLKELDDRLALIKQFPSVLDADKVDVFELTENGSKEIRDNWGRCKMHLDEGKWKILILAKKVD